MMHRVARRHWWAAAAAVLVAIAGAVLSVSALIALQNQGRTLVAGYLGAIQRGHIEEALHRAGIVPRPDDVLLHDSVYARTSDHIRSFEVSAPVVTGETATVTATIRLADRSYRQTFALERAGGLPGLPLWRFGHVDLSTVDVEMDGPEGISFTVAGATPTYEGGQAVALRAFPAMYPVAVTSENRDFRLENADVRALDPDEKLDPALFTATLSAAGEATGRKAVAAWLDACAASTDAAPADCPFSAAVPDGTRASDIHWTFATLPDLQVDRKWNGGGWTVRGTAGSAFASATITQISDGSATQRRTAAIPFSYSGLLTSEPDGIHFLPLLGDAPPWR